MSVRRKKKRKKPDFGVLGCYLCVASNFLMFILNLLSVVELPSTVYAIISVLIYSGMAFGILCSLEGVILNESRKFAYSGLAISLFFTVIAVVNNI